MGILGGRLSWRPMFAVVLLIAGGIFTPAVATATALERVQNNAPKVADPVPGKPSETKPKPVARTSLGLAKAAGPVTANSDGTFSVSFSMLLQNTGAASIDQVQVWDNIAREISPAGLVTVSAISVSGALSTVNPAFNGITDDRLLTGDQSLLPGEQASINFSVTFDANGNPGPFFNRAK